MSMLKLNVNINYKYITYYYIIKQVVHTNDLRL